jgi:hypothetical protein
MDAEQLKLLAGRLADWLAHHQHLVKHGHTLDFMAAIPGLRNWPEVLSFPERVANAEISELACQRLAQRITKKIGVTFSAQELQAALAAPPATVVPLTVWPDGPAAGVYVTDSQAAVEAAIARYEAATDGALLYAEDAGCDAAGAIELGEYGLFSNGLARAPSGTLVVVGPVEMAQETWENNRDRVGAAANLALDAGLRVVVLCTTPMPQSIRDDVVLLLREAGWEDRELAASLRGIVAEDGALVTAVPFAPGRSLPVPTPVTPTFNLPDELAEVLRAGIAVRPFGLILIGTWGFKLSRAELIEATLPLTEHAGPAARIQDNFHTDYDGNPPISERFSSLPVFPSVESAYASGYRRMVFERPTTLDKVVLARTNDVCFHVASVAMRASDALLRAGSMARADEPSMLAKTTAILCSGEIEAKKGPCVIYDAMAAQPDAPASLDFDEAEAFVESRRTVRWEDQLRLMHAQRKLTLTEAKKAFHNLPVAKVLADSA